MRNGTSGRGVLVALGLAACVGVAACGGSSTTTVTATSSTAAPSTSTQAPATQTKTATATSTGASAAPQAGAIADYQPSTVVRKNGFVTVLRSPDSVGKVGAFYKAQLAKGGWQVRSASENAFHATFNAHRDNEGVTIAVFPMGSGSGITVTRHPE